LPFLLASINTFLVVHVLHLERGGARRVRGSYGGQRRPGWVLLVGFVRLFGPQSGVLCVLQGRAGQGRVR
jgi:hypothetical protein